MKHLAYLVIVLSAACSKSEPPAVVADPVVAKPTEPAVAPAPTPSATRAPAVTSVTEAGKTLDWDVGSERFGVTFTDTDNPVLRVTVQGATHEVPLIGMGGDRSLTVLDGGVVYVSELWLASKSDPMIEHAGMRVEWDAVARKLITAQTWTCDEGANESTCKRPAWMPPARLKLDVDGVSYEVTAVDIAKQRHVRLAAASSTFDVPVSGGDEEWLRVVGNAVVYWSRRDVPNPMEVSLHGFHASRIAWNAAEHKPVVTKTWACQENTAPCREPAWVGRNYVDPNAEVVDD